MQGLTQRFIAGNSETDRAVPENGRLNVRSQTQLLRSRFSRPLAADQEPCARVESKFAIGVA